jgi:hypothetical protein
MKIDMKTIFRIFPAIAAIFLAVACGNSTKEATSVANDFLSAYFATEYQTAAGCCTPELGEALMVAVQEYYEMEENLQQDVMDISSQVVTTITSIETISRDSVLVRYDIDMPEPEPTLHSTLTITNTDGKWRVAEF